MADAEHLRELKNGHDGRIALPALEIGQVLL
jgi:hypothetical protein